MPRKAKADTVFDAREAELQLEIAKLEGELRLTRELRKALSELSKRSSRAKRAPPASNAQPIVTDGLGPSKPA